MAETLTWVTGAGDELLLSSGDLTWLRGRNGRGMPPVEVTERQLATGVGSVATRVRAGARVVPVPILVAASPLRDRLRQAAALFDPTVEGKLVAEDAAAGWARELPCRYIGGFEWDEQLPHGMWQVPRFKAFYPYWRDTENTTATVSQGETGLWLPWPDITVVADDVFAALSIENNGDVEAWPVWTITGPADTVTLESDNGDILTVAYALTAGETLTIDTRPGVKTVKDQNGTNRFSSLDTADDDLFSFPVGTTVVSATIASATEASQVGLAWRRYWWTA